MKQYILEVPAYRGGTEIKICRSSYPEPEAQLAEKLAINLAVLAMRPEGESSNGEMKLALLSPPEVAERACEIASAMFAEFKKRDWMLEMPAPKLAQKEEEQP